MEMRACVEMGVADVRMGSAEGDGAGHRTIVPPSGGRAELGDPVAANIGGEHVADSQQEEEEVAGKIAVALGVKRPRCSSAGEDPGREARAKRARAAAKGINRLLAQERELEAKAIASKVGHLRASSGTAAKALDELSRRVRARLLEAGSAEGPSDADMPRAQASSGRSGCASLPGN